MLFLFAACDESGGGDSSVAAAGVIELAPGQTSVALAWEPSEGVVAGYMVFGSRNGAPYDFLGNTVEPRANINGRAGDAVQVMVLALNVDGHSSAPSDPSAILRFRAANPAAAQAVEAPPAQVPEPVASPEATQIAAEAPSSENIDDGQGGLAANAETDPVAAAAADGLALVPPIEADRIALDDATPMEAALRALLLRADIRLSAAPLSDAVQRWLEARVEENFEAGVRLVGSGDRDRDGIGELVWQDPAGQLFVSMGADIDGLEHNAAVPGTFEEAPRLAATERYAGLADLDGDGVADWIIEETATGTIWLVDGETSVSRPARSSAEGEDAVLVGHGDFDGDGRHELLWSESDESLHLGHPEGTTPTFASPLPQIEPGRLLAVVDLDQDGRDDLLLRGEGNRLEQILTVVLDDGSGLDFRAESGPEGPRTALGLDFVATLDLDADGTIEVAWLVDDALEVWDLATGDTLDFEP